MSLENIKALLKEGKSLEALLNIRSAIKNGQNLDELLYQAAVMHGASNLTKHTLKRTKGVIPKERDQLQNYFSTYQQYVDKEDQLLRLLSGLPQTEEIKTIVFVGAHYFQEKDLLFRIFPGLKKIHIFEPIPRLSDFLRKSQSHDNRVQVHQIAISDRNGRQKFNLTDNAMASSSLLDFDKHTDFFPEVSIDRIIDVEGRNLEQLLKEGKLETPDLLILDVQGAEGMILDSFSSELKQVIKIIYTETSKTPLYKGTKTLEDIKSILAPEHTFLSYFPLNKRQDEHGNALFINQRMLSEAPNQQEHSNTSINEKFDANQTITLIENSLLSSEITDRLSMIQAQTPERAIYIWGTGNYGQAIEMTMSELGFNISGFIDNNTSKHGTRINQISVISPDCLNKKPFIIIGSMYILDIAEQLEKQGYTILQDYILPPGF